MLYRVFYFCKDTKFGSGIQIFRPKKCKKMEVFYIGVR